LRAQFINRREQANRFHAVAEAVVVLTRIDHELARCLEVGAYFSLLRRTGGQARRSGNCAS
jgi:hypothetical protein